MLISWKQAVANSRRVKNSLDDDAVARRDRKDSRLTTRKWNGTSSESSKIVLTRPDPGLIKDANFPAIASTETREILDSMSYAFVLE
jgi:hypothetical protein